MPDPTDLAARRNIAAPFVTGVGVEIGAGLDPSLPPGADITFIDGRTSAELQAHFGTAVPYEVRSLQEMLRATGASDFLIAHHVVEHCSNPIGQVAAWLPLLRDGGRLFISIPSDDNISALEKLS